MQVSGRRQSRRTWVFEMSAGKCKRVAASSSDDDSPCSDDTSVTTTTDTEPVLPTLTADHDHDYDVSSPGSSSTLSGGGGGGPSVMRLPGFTHYSQDMPRRPRMKKKKADVNGEDVVHSHSEQTAGQLACSRLAKPQQLTPRTKAPRGTTQPLCDLLWLYSDVSQHYLLMVLWPLATHILLLLLHPFNGLFSRTT